MVQTSARLLRLLSLLQVRRFWSGAELAERLEITPRTLRRDIDRLRSLGYPIEGTAGVAGGYQLAAGAELPPLSLADDEALAVSIALRTAASRATGAIDEAALRALVKLERVLPPRLRRRANALRASIVLLERRGPQVSSETLATLAGACDEHHRVELAYGDRNGNTSERVVEPAGLVHTGRHWYLVAWDAGRGDWRTFRVDRITAATMGDRFAPRPPPADGDLSAYVSRSVSTDAYPFQARVMLEAPLEKMAEHISPKSGVLERLDDSRCVLTLGGRSLDSLARWISIMGVEFQVLEPRELIVHLRALEARIGRAIAAATL
jgi:predicted DNA-binding transcriptional regulator YafY